MAGKDIYSNIYDRIISDEYKEMRRIMNKAKYAAGVTFSVFALDRLFKESIESESDSEFPKPLPGPMASCGNYEKHHNDGFALGFMNKYPQFIKLTQLSTCFAVAGTLCAELVKKGNALLITGLGLVLGGGLSNLFDRYKTGYVVDYLNFKAKPLNRLILNIGDIAIFVGAVLSGIAYALGLIKKHKNKH